MNQIIAMFFPTFIALKIYEHLNQNKLKTKDIIIYYFILNTVINLTMYSITIYAFSNPTVIFSDSFTIKYIAVAIVLAAIMPILLFAIQKSIDIKIEKHK